ncbi:hypothetical protein BC628DRAFT_711867 [Trametes gibbosa]|nr:hypothetical protein BC628DRAFT_711867 [Trametes gibbosa]
MSLLVPFERRSSFTRLSIPPYSPPCQPPAHVFTRCLPTTHLLRPPLAVGRHPTPYAPHRRWSLLYFTTLGLLIAREQRAKFDPRHLMLWTLAYPPTRDPSPFALLCCAARTRAVSSVVVPRMRTRVLLLGPRILGYCTYVACLRQLGHCRRCGRHRPHSQVPCILSLVGRCAGSSPLTSIFEWAPSLCLALGCRPLIIPSFPSPSPFSFPSALTSTGTAPDIIRTRTLASFVERFATSLDLRYVTLLSVCGRFRDSMPIGVVCRQQVHAQMPTADQHFRSSYLVSREGLSDCVCATGTMLRPLGGRARS